MSQPEFAQGYRLAVIFRNKFSRTDRPIVQLQDVLNNLDVKIEVGCESDLIPTAGCASSGDRAHIIPSVVWHNGYTSEKSRFAISATLEGCCGGRGNARTLSVSLRVTTRC
jgi:hypothetical protein